MMKTSKDDQVEDDIFISYSHEDREIVRNIAEIIKGLCNHAVWCDDSLRGGDNYFGVIADQIVSSKFFAFMVSGNSVTSKWCLRELEYAVSKDKIIVPIWLDDIVIPSRVELSIQNTHYIRYYQISQEEFSVEIKKVFSNGCPDEKNSAISRMDELISAANLGDEGAIFRVATGYAVGDYLGFPKDETKAVEWFIRLAELNGDYAPLAQCELSGRYMDGRPWAK